MFLIQSKFAFILPEGKIYCLRKVRQTEVTILMLNHVKEVIFESNEPKSLKSLLAEYNNLLTSYNMEGITRVTTIKEMLQEEFHERIHKNKMIVYNKAECSPFIDVALHSFGISDEQLIYNVSTRLHPKCKNASNMEWPPFVSHLKDEGNIESVTLSRFFPIS